MMYYIDLYVSQSPRIQEYPAMGHSTYWLMCDYSKHL